MTTEHPITPPPELVEQWRTAPEYTTGKKMFTMVSVSTRRLQEVATQAARWGADQELEACCEWLETYVQRWAEWSADFRADRRPKLPSLKEQALAELELLRGDANAHGLGFDAPAIRRALEALPE